MSKMNVLVAINAYNDSNPTNHPTKNVTKWVNDLQGVDIVEPVSASMILAAGQTLQLFSSAVTLSQDISTSYEIYKKMGTSNTYVIALVGGVSPAFRTARVSGADATTEVTVTQNGPLLTFTSTGGTNFDLQTNSVIAGDEVRIGALFNLSNQGKFKIISLTSNSFTVNNPNGAAEGPILLDTGFATQVSIYSSAGVQIADTLRLSTNFSPISWGIYEITDVGPDYIEFYSAKSLPTENGISSVLEIFNTTKQFIYIESDKKVSVTIDGNSNGNIEPFKLATNLKPGMFLKNSFMYSASITNISADSATIYYMFSE